MKIILSLIVPGFAAVCLSGCGHDDSPATASVTDSQSSDTFSGRLIISGSSTMAPLVAEIARRFESRYPDVRIDVQSGGSGKGIADALSGIADIGMASRALKEDERDLTAHQIAADGVCLIVHESNPVVELTDEQVLAIYRDESNNWTEFGGPDLAITVVHKAEGRATLEVFLNHFKIENTSIRPDVIVGDNEHGVKTVAAARGAIGYVSIGTAEADVRTGAPIRLLAEGGIAATSENVAQGTFPMSRPLNLVTSTSPGPLAAAFINFCQSEEVHDLVVSQFFVPLGS